MDTVVDRDKVKKVIEVVKANPDLLRKLREEAGGDQQIYDLLSEMKNAKNEDVVGLDGKGLIDLLLSKTDADRISAMMTIRIYFQERYEKSRDAPPAVLEVRHDVY